MVYKCSDPNCSECLQYDPLLLEGICSKCVSPKILKDNKCNDPPIEPLVEEEEETVNITDKVIWSQKTMSALVLITSIVNFVGNG